jgi:hypothetical protein
MTQTDENSHKRIGAILLALFGILAVVLGVLKIRNTVYAPFALKNILPTDIKQQVVDNNIGYQRQLDTDHDGLNDFDELSVYSTSPYLYDTFGYGISDAEVIKRGLRLCPNAGKNCSDGETASVQTGAASSSLISTFGPGSDISSITSTVPDLESIISNPKQLRQILIQSGKITAAELNKIPDADLVKAAQLIFNTSSTPSSVSSTVSSTGR